MPCIHNTPYDLNNLYYILRVKYKFQIDKNIFKKNNNINIIKVIL